MDPLTLTQAVIQQMKVTCKPQDVLRIFEMALAFQLN